MTLSNEIRNYYNTYKIASVGETSSKGNSEKAIINALEL